VTCRQKATVSLCMIVRNEEQQLAECLTPVASLFDEIVVVDTGSRDGTKQIASRFTPGVFDFPWCDDFAAARNESLRHAHGYWIFWLDADDRVSPANIDRLRLLLSSLGHKPRAYMMETACASQYACEGINLITHPRLIRRHPALRWQGRVHEQLRPPLPSLGYELVWSEVQIVHLGYRDAAVQRRKLNRDVRLLRMDYAIDPDDASTLLHLGMAYLHLGSWQQASQCLTRVLDLPAAQGDHLRQVYGALANIAIREGNLSQALQTLDAALRSFPDDDYLLYLRADSLYEVDRFNEARDVLQQIVLSPGNRRYRGGVPGDIREKAAPRKLADVLRLQGNHAAAEALLLSIVIQFPDDTLSWHLLGRVYLDSRQRVKLLSVVERLRACPQGEVFGGLLLATWHLEHREYCVAGPLIEQLISLAPQMPFPRVLRAEWLTRMGASLAERIQACRDVLRVQPGNLDVNRVLRTLEAQQQSATAPRLDEWCSSVILGAGVPDCISAT
jgi:glycosyltransferase involved in cell wall biosynthesis